MKKIFTLLLLFSVTLAFGQSLQVSYEGRTINSGDTVSMAVDNPRGDNFYHFDIRNTTEDTIWIQIKKEDVSVVEGTTNTFCFGECYEGNTSDIMPAAGGQTLSHSNGSPHYFYSNYAPNEHIGVTVVKYRIINSGDESDEVCFTAIYSHGVKICNAKAEVLSFNAYPNPAESQVLIKYNLKSSASNEVNLVLKNIMGQTIYRGRVGEKSDSITIDISTFPAGLYLYSLESNGAILLTKKLYIK